MVNGHRVVILSNQREEVEDSLPLVGGDRIRSLKVGDSEFEEQRTLNKLAKSAKAGIIVASHELGINQVLKNLEEQLPWIQ